MCSPSGSGDYVLTQWLEHDGDEREAKPARTKTNFSCDEAGCTIKTPGFGLLAVAQHERALDDDCREAGVLISRVPIARPCPGPRLTIEGRLLYRTGAVAVYLDGKEGGFRLVTSAEMRGDRPWTAHG